MTQKFPIREIVLNQRCQARVEPHPDIVDEYAAAYRSKAKMPPVDVFIVDGAPHLIDGWHRISGAIKAEATWITCEIVGTGTLEEAVWKALAANQTHGIRRTNEDKRRAVRLALESPIGNEQSNRVIAEHVGVSHPFVERIRTDMEASRRAEVLGQVADIVATKTGDVETVTTSTVEKRRDSAGRMQPARKPAARPVAEPEPEPVAVDYPVEDDVPLPHEPETPTVGMPPHGPELLRCAGLIAKLRVSLRAAALPNGTLQTIESELKLTEHRLRGGVPEVCPRCHGAICGHCYSQGWVTRDRGDSLREIDKRRAQ